MLFDGALVPIGLSIGALRQAGGTVPLADPGPGGSLARRGVDVPLRCVPEALRSTLERAHTLFARRREDDADRFLLVTRRNRNTLNSTLQNVLTDDGQADPNPLWMHPDDGARLGLAPGDRARIGNGYGSIEAGARYDRRLRRGVVAMTHGFGNASTTGMPRGPGPRRRERQRPRPHRPGDLRPGERHVAHHRHPRRRDAGGWATGRGSPVR